MAALRGGEGCPAPRSCVRWRAFAATALPRPTVHALLLDMGNTRLKAAVLDPAGGRRQASWPLAPDPPWQALLDWLGAGTGGGLRRAFLASVTTPARREALRRALGRAGVAVELVGPPASDALLQLAYARPERLGVDRWLAMRALRAEQTGPFLIAGCGSALTVDVVDAAGRHLGGVIAPSPERSLEALQRRARHLPAAPAAVRPFADNTEDAVWSGAVLSAVGLIERLHAEAEHRLDREVAVVLAGGGAATLAPHLHGPVVRREHAVLEGLAALAAAAESPARRH
jgi:type III pantothenate kinase